MTEVFGFDINLPVEVIILAALFLGLAGGAGAMAARRRRRE